MAKIARVLQAQIRALTQGSRANYEYQQILLANPDQVVLVFAASGPQPAHADRFLVVAEKQEIPAVIVANKLTW